MRPVRMGAGLMHRCALSVSDEDAPTGWRDYRNGGGVATTEIKDRAYFRRIDLHDPDGHIVEIATDTPGFTSHETESKSERTPQRPALLQSRRKEIERNLAPTTERDPTGR